MLAALAALAAPLSAQTTAPWTLTGAPTNANWFSLAVPPKGGTLAAAVYGGGIYVSTNGGSNWRLTAAPSQNWYSIACSSNGSTLAAAVWSGGIYTSTNSGTTWKQTSAATRYWDSVVLSYDGRKLAAAANNDGIYTSTNSGSTWQKTSAPALNWYTLASSSDGGKLAALVYGGGIHTSTNGGTTWTKSSAPDEYWGGLAGSADGSKLVAGVYADGGIHISTNSGASWTLTDAPSTNWLSLASSETGLILLAGVDGGGVYVSTNSGGDWDLTAAPVKNWYSVATSPSGSRFFGVVHLGGIYTSQMPVVLNATVTEDTPTALPAKGQLDGTNFIFALVTSPTNGTVSGFGTNNPGTLTYTPNTNYLGADWFAFTAYDGQFYTTGTVSLTIEPVNDAPVAVNRDIVVLDIATTNLVLTATDVDGDSLTYAIDVSPAHGSLSVIDPDTDAVTYTPEANYYGDDSFTFIASDGEFDSIGFVNIMIVAAPVVNSQTISMPEDSATNLVLTATDADSAILTYAIAQHPAHGSLSVIDPDTGAVTYAPAANYRGADSFTFTAYDGELYTTGTVSFTITAATNWHSVAMTEAGDLMAVVDYGGGIYTSTNRGVSWKKTSAPDRNWVSVVASFEGDFLAAAAQGEGIYTSTNRGSSWEKTSAPDTNWVAMVTSFNGVKLAAASRGEGIYTSTDAGTSWQKTSAPALDWSAMAGTFPGGTLGATAQGSGIYYSTDGGTNWNLSLGTDVEGFDNWTCLALAANVNEVQLVTAGIGGGGIENASDFESTWTPSFAPEMNWRGIAASETGDFLVAAAEGGVHTSSDRGESWSLTAAPAADWHSVAVSSDGTKYIAVAYGGAIYNWETPTRLNLEQLPGLLRFSWINMAASAGFALQQNTGFNPANWVNVDGNLYPPNNSLNLIVQDLPLPATNTFYRLKR